MTPNVGGIERVSRLVLGIVLLAVGLSALSGVAKAVALVLGAIAAGTALIRFCPINALLGVNTCKARQP